MNLKTILLAAGLAVALSGPGYAAGMFNGFPVTCGAASGTGPGNTTPTLTPTGNAGAAAAVLTTVPAGPCPPTGNELQPADTALPQGQSPQTVLIPLNVQAAFFNGLPGASNVLIGGDATTNLFQRATTGASETTTYAYGGPDRWAYWSGTGTAVTVSRDSTAADLQTGYQYAFKMARTSGQTGVVQTCMAQEVESANAYQFAGTTAELDFHATTGANFSAANSNMTAYIVYGTGADEGMQKLAWGLNAGGGGSTAWTGQANATAAVISLGGVSTAGRYAAIANIPATATEIGVALCYTPVGTAGTNDYIAFGNIQLRRNTANAAFASATVGYASTAVPLASFERRPSFLEAQYQYRYFYKLTEGAAIQTRAECFNSDTTHAQCQIYTPVPMRIAPVFTGDGGFTAGFATPTTTAGTTLGNCSALALSALVASTVASTNNFVVQCTATTVPAAGTTGFMYDNNGAGVMKASSEL